jgi:hypothetical protein
MYHCNHNLLDGLMLSLSPIVVPFSRWICWDWTIARSAGATTLIARGVGATASVPSSLSSGLHQVPAIVSDTASNSLARHDNILSHLGIHPLADVRRTSSVQCSLAKTERVA